MSFAATAALIAAYAAWSDWRSRRPRERPAEGSVLRTGLTRTLGWVGGIAMTSLIAGSATALYGVWHFHRMSPLGLVANLLAMPVVSLTVMPSAVLAGVLMPFGLDGPALDLMGRGIGAMLSIARWLAERTPFDAVGAVPLAAVAALTTALVLATALTTWLRALALPFLAAGLALVAARDLPDLMVSEDATLVAMRTASGDLSVNRARPNGFVTGIWKDAAMARAVLRPGALATATPGPDGVAAALASLAPGTGFLCEGALCIARHHGGGAVAVLPEGTPVAPFCAVASVIVLDDAAARRLCAAGAAMVLTKRDLARRGSAEVDFDGMEEQRAGFAQTAAIVATRADAGDGAMVTGGMRVDGRPPVGVDVPPPRVRMRQAIREPFRPWHDHRRYSRAARGMAPYRPEDRPAAAEAAPATERRQPEPAAGAAGQ